ncbi:MAG TPA: CehA/McbA family metallohydrolase [Steroidobacteraceae bacterium]|jgi:Tol biopolymer transport system component
MSRKILCVLGGMVLLGAALPGLAQRQAVLRQIDLPHPYYFREMYLPQLTSGPSSLAWSPDSRELVYSMAGSLWRQEIRSGIARQLSESVSYDYQPDWSADGRWIVYSSYRHDALELWLLDTTSGQSQPLLQNGAVNLEPRFSPDGRRLLFVSSLLNGHFHIFVGDFSAGKLTNVQRLTGEHKSDLPRYYYSAVDHEISPVWSRDGREILFISNRNHIYGTGGFWRMPAEPGAQASEIHYEETNWRARPDLSPDGSRLVYGSYVGRSWHNLWVLPAHGGDAFAITFGDWDQVNPRWSPDGQRIAFITNRDGNTALAIVAIPGGAIQRLTVTERRYLHEPGHLHILLSDAQGQPAAARLSVIDSAGLFHAPQDAWIHADDGFDRKERAFEAHYFHALGEATLDVPAGGVQLEVMRGFEGPLQRRAIQVSAGQTAEVHVTADEGAWGVPAPGHWISADVHVHMNYGGVYRNTPTHLLLQAQAENLNVVESLIVNKEQRFPDIAFNGLQLDPASRADTLIVHGQEYHTSYWGHLGLLRLSGGIILPGYVGYPNTAASSLFPSNADVADIAHGRGALVGYVHPFDDPPHPFDSGEKLTDELPVDVALGKVDYMEIVGFSDHRATADVWYRLLNLGWRIPAAGGTDAMANFASLRGPVGMNRVYAQLPDRHLSQDSFVEALRHGHTFATNGPLLGFTLGGMQPGEAVHLQRAQHAHFVARLRSIVPLEHLDLVCNGRVVRSLLHSPAARGDYTGEVTLGQSGWCLLRAWSEGARYPILDKYPYATTSPVYVQVDGSLLRSPGDAAYFVAWIDRVTEATTAYPDWNNATEKAHVLAQLAAARAIYSKMR